MDMNDPFGIITWITDLMRSINFSEELITVIMTAMGVFLVATIVLVIFIFLTWLERKVAARFQDRIGPNRVGPFGLLQPIADAIKMVTKEDTTPDAADKVPYQIAPYLAVIAVLLMWAVVPFAPGWQGTRLNVGVLYMVAAGSLGVIAVLMAGWSSNNKYALLGTFRAVAQLITYEVPLFLAMLVPVYLAGSMDVTTITESQATVLDQYILYAPLAFVIFFIANLAEIGRTPFDLLEAESEIIAGYHVEYSGMKFGMFQAGEFIHAFTSAAMIGILFFGGWQGPGVEQAPLLGLVYFFGKTFFFYFIMMWSRSTLPRIRIDQMMNLGWKVLIPMSIVLLMVTPVLDYFVRDLGIVRMLSHLGANLVIGFIALGMVARADRQGTPERVQFDKNRPLAVPPKEEASA